MQFHGSPFVPVAGNMQPVSNKASCFGVVTG